MGEGRVVGGQFRGGGGDSQCNIEMRGVMESRTGYQ